MAGLGPKASLSASPPTPTRLPRPPAWLHPLTPRLTHVPLTKDLGQEKHFSEESLGWGRVCAKGPLWTGVSPGQAESPKPTPLNSGHLTLFPLLVFPEPGAETMTPAP